MFIVRIVRSVQSVQNSRTGLSIFFVRKTRRMLPRANFEAMLSKVIKEKLEHRMGRQIRYPKDCELLAADISKACNCRLSGSTLKRLFGFVKGGGNPRLYTLDMISAYLGHGKWEDLLSSLTGQQPQKQAELEHLDVASLEKGSTLLITYAPAREVAMEALGNGLLRVVASNEPLLDSVEMVRLTEIKLHYPLYLEIPGKTFGIWLAQISGVTSIKLPYAIL